MKKRRYLLTTLLLISSLAVAAMGGYIKYGILLPMGIERDENIMQIPFVYMTDDGLRFMVALRREMDKQPAPLEEHTDTVPVLTSEPSAETVPEMPTEISAEDVFTAPPTEAPTEPVYEPVDDSWFDDALFIGDSRAHALRAYCRMGEATYFTSVGMNIYNVFGTWNSDRTYSKMPLDRLLQKKSFGKVLINIGLNECNYDHAYIEAGFEKLINMIHEYQPDAKVILMSVMVTTEKFAKRDVCYQIENISQINEIIASFADGESVYYMDSNAWIVNEKGYLPEEVTGDGVHLYATACEKWAEWIRQQCATYAIN